MWYIIKDEDRIELEFGSMDIFDYVGETIFCDDEDIINDIDEDGGVVEDDFLLEWGWFEDTEDWGIVNAYRKNIGCSVQEAFDQWEEAYQGEFDSDEDFAESFAEELGYIGRELTWPFNCIDWQEAAKEIMLDYFEQDGYYFRSL